MMQLFHKFGIAESKTIYVWRLEDRLSREGIYCGKGFEVSYEFQHSEFSHPCPTADGALMWTNGLMDDWYFGFSDLNQLDLWINEREWKEGLVNLNYVLRLYAVPERDYRASRTQCIFRRSGAKLISTIDNWIDYDKTKEEEVKEATEAAQHRTQQGVGEFSEFKARGETWKEGFTSTAQEGFTFRGYDQRTGMML